VNHVLWLTLEVTVGCSPEQAAEELAEITARLGIPTQAKFNGMLMLCALGESKDTILRRFKPVWEVRQAFEKLTFPKEAVK